MRPPRAFDHVPSNGQSEPDRGLGRLRKCDAYAQPYLPGGQNTVPRASAAVLLGIQVMGHDSLICVAWLVELLDLDHMLSAGRLSGLVEQREVREGDVGGFFGAVDLDYSYGKL
jgi:hypothetical protein